MFRNGNRLYKFGAFNFNADENVLRLGDKPVSLTPKMLELLRVLIENQGQIVEKDDLMRQVWANSFVEEGNLTFTIRQLRKVFDDDARRPVFIETVPRRGYRFIHEVQIFEDQRACEQTKETPPDFSLSMLPLIPSQISASSTRKISFSLLAAAFLLVTALGGWYARSSSRTSVDAPVLSAPFAVEKLSTSGKVEIAVISPDGRTVAYQNIASSGRQSLWLRQLETSINVEIVPPSADLYFGLAFSPDGDSLYFARRPQNVEGQTNIYLVSILGGVPQQIVGEAQGAFSLSPDGKQISFVRCFYLKDENCSLWIADASDGKNERKIVSRSSPIRIGDNRISPDGAKIAFAAGQSENQANEFGLFEIDIRSGAERELTPEKFFNVKNLAWLPAQDELLFTARKNDERNFRVRHVAADSGTVSLLTNDSETYTILSLDRTAERLISVQVKEDLRLRVFDQENATRGGEILANATAVSFAPDGNIVFASSMSGNSDLWSINQGGGEQRQLTGDAAEETTPIVAPDNRTIFFASNRTGAAHVWRINRDGSNKMQITQTEGGFPLFVSPDGRWVYYHSSSHRTLRRVSTDGSGNEQLILNKAAYRFAVSPDGSQAAFAEKRGKERVLSVVSLADGQTSKTFKLADAAGRITELAFLPDGKALTYILTNAEFEESVLWRQMFDAAIPPERVADLGDEGIWNFALAHDGEKFAVVQGGWLHDAVLLRGLK